MPKLQDVLAMLPDVPEPVKDATGYNRFMATADAASNAANSAFPGQDWDNTPA